MVFQHHYIAHLGKKKKCNNNFLNYFLALISVSCLFILLLGMRFQVYVAIFYPACLYMRIRLEMHNACVFCSCLKRSVCAIHFLGPTAVLVSAWVNSQHWTSLLTDWWWPNGLLILLPKDKLIAAQYWFFSKKKNTLSKSICF